MVTARSRSLLCASIAMSLLAACYLPTVGEGGSSAGSETTSDVDPSGATTRPWPPTGGTSTTGSGSSESSAGVATVEPATDDGESFIAFPDGGVCHCQCDPWSQDCPRGEKCAPWAIDGGDEWNATRCVPVYGDAGPGDACIVEGSPVTGLDDCDGASMCFWVDPVTNAGECAAFCGGDIGDPTCTGACATCVVAYDGVLTLCLPQCDPLAQSCGDGRACLVEPGGDRFVCLPAPVAPGMAGDPCEPSAIACAPGLACVPAEQLTACADTNCCAPLCNMTATDPCPLAAPEIACMPWWRPGAEPPAECTPSTLGACVLP
jgi:hypothetical protein